MTADAGGVTAGKVIGFVGLGNMGIPMTRRLVAAGHQVRGFDTSAEAMRAVGISGLLLLGGYLAWASRRRRTIGFSNWTVSLPSGRSTLIQIGIGLADLGCSSLAMYNLLPPSVQGEPVTIMIAVVSATLLGFASHAPGSLGVFEAAMLVALPEVPKEELLAAIVVFRMVYFYTPFCLALLTMACWESVLFVRRSRAASGNGNGATALPEMQISDRPPYIHTKKEGKP